MKLSVISLSDKRKPADLFYAGIAETGKISKELHNMEPLASKNLKSSQNSGRFAGKFLQHLNAYGADYNEAKEISFVGLGDPKKFENKKLHRVAGRIFQTAKIAKAKKIRIYLDSLTGGKVSLQDAANIITEVAMLSSYTFDHYKKMKKKSSSAALSVEVMVSKKSSTRVVEAQISRSQAIAEGTLLTRNLINEPGNVMTATRMAQEAKSLAKKKKLSCTVLGASEIKRLKMGGILAVNSGSITPPALIILEHGKSYKSKGTICLVGKGVTFDTGGISIKPSKDMEKMKYDMSGAAAVIGAMSAIADLKIKMHVVGITPAVENNVANDPTRPGDIIKMFNGKSVEVLNTDAEGRLILADALSYCAKFKPKAIVDLATLTGMCAYTFGDKAIAVLGNDAKLINKLKKAGQVTGQRCWELPMWEEYGDSLRGHHSDLLNIGGPYGGTITAAKFLEAFIPEKTAWAHLDIAGTAWCNSPRYDNPIGGTGVGVKLLAELLSSWSSR